QNCVAEKKMSLQEDVHLGDESSFGANSQVSDAFTPQWARWIVLAATPDRPTGRDKTFVLFSVKDSHGALYESLAAFKLFNVNLLKIESRPSPNTGEHDFFVELLGHCDEAAVKRAVDSLKLTCKKVKILGACPIPPKTPTPTPLQPAMRSLFYQHNASSGN